MSKVLRDTLIDPMIRKDLSVQVTALNLTPPEGDSILGSGVLKREDDRFVIEVIYTEGDGTAFRNPASGFHGRRDKWKVSGNIRGVIPFETDAYVDLKGSHHGDLVAEYLRIKTTHLRIPARGDDTLSSAQQTRFLRQEEPGDADIDSTKFSATLVYHGVELCLQTHGTKTKVINDFLGELPSGALDTHVFEGDGYRGALIQSGKELHLHLKSSEDATRRWTPVELESFVDDVSFAVALAHDCQPWPCSRVVRLDDRITRREVVAHTHLRQGMSRVVALGRDHGTPNAAQFIPTVAVGLARLSDSDRKMLRKFNWQLHATDVSAVPFPVRLLVKCSALEGLVKVILEIRKELPNGGKRPDGSQKSAFEAGLERVLEKLNLPSTGVFEDLYDAWKSHRNTLAHGWLDFSDEEALDTEVYHDQLLHDAYMKMLFCFLGFRDPIRAPSLKLKPKAAA